MSNSKISDLTAASTPLAGTEVFPAVQSGTTVKTSIANVQVAPVSSGTANGIQYLNGSKVPTTGTAFQFDGTKVYNNLTAPPSGWSGIGTSWWVKQSNANGGFYAIASGSDAGIFMGHNGTLGQISVSYGNTAGYTPLGFYTSDTLRWQLETNGNLTQKTAGTGINFTANTPASGMTSQNLTWYEEGTWTPTVTPGGGSLTAYTSSGKYVKVGKNVYLTGHVQITTAGTASGQLNISGLPFTAGNNINQIGLVREDQNTGVIYYIATTGASTNAYIQSATNGPVIWLNGYGYAFSFTYLST